MRRLFLRYLNIFVILCKEEKCEGNFQKQIFQELLKRFPSILICEVVYMQGRKYVNFIHSTIEQLHLTNKVSVTLLKDHGCRWLLKLHHL